MRAAVNRSMFDGMDFSLEFSIIDLVKRKAGSSRHGGGFNELFFEKGKWGKICRITEIQEIYTAALVREATQGLLREADGRRRPSGCSAGRTGHEKKEKGNGQANSCQCRAVGCAGAVYTCSGSGH